MKREEMADMKREAVVMVPLGVVRSAVALRRCFVGVVSGVAASFGIPFVPELLRVSGCGGRPSALAAPAGPLSQLTSPPPPRGLSAGDLPLALPSPVKGICSEGDRECVFLVGEGVLLLKANGSKLGKECCRRWLARL